jgi:hypothetical protein
MKKPRQAQSTFELSVLITVVLAALLVMGVYLKRGLQGRWKSSVDEMGEQYDPWAMNGSITFRAGGTTETRIIGLPSGDGIWTTRTDFSNTTESKFGTMRVGSPP